MKVFSIGGLVELTSYAVIFPVLDMASLVAPFVSRTSELLSFVPNIAVVPNEFPPCTNPPNEETLAYDAVVAKELDTALDDDTAKEDDRILFEPNGPYTLDPVIKEDVCALLAHDEVPSNEPVNCPVKDPENDPVLLKKVSTLFAVNINEGVLG